MITPNGLDVWASVKTYPDGRKTFHPVIEHVIFENVEFATSQEAIDEAAKIAMEDAELDA